MKRHRFFLLDDARGVEVLHVVAVNWYFCKNLVGFIDSVPWEFCGSFRQSMDMYSALHSPNISLFSPGLHHRLSSSHLGSSYQRLPLDGPVTPSATQPLGIPFLPPGQKVEPVLPYSDPIRKLEDEFITPDVVYVPEVVKAPGSSFLQGLFNGENPKPFFSFGYVSLMIPSESRSGIRLLHSVISVTCLCVTEFLVCFLTF